MYGPNTDDLKFYEDFSSFTFNTVIFLTASFFTDRLLFNFIRTEFQSPKLYITTKPIDDFFCFNTDQTSGCIKWDGFKAFLRGQIISYTSYKSKKAKRDKTQLEAKIKHTPLKRAIRR